MLGVGRERAVKRGHVDSAEIQWQEANAEVLPFEDNSFDLYTIAFGIRNCTHVDRVVAEAYRVSKQISHGPRKNKFFAGISSIVSRLSQIPLNCSLKLGDRC
jgi:ubiquinone/menaquinone biosynthesis C-methylase UbiE